MTGDAMREVIDSALDASIEGEFGGLAASADEIAVIRDYVLAAITAAGYAVVPVEATDVMLSEAYSAAKKHFSHEARNAARYRAMIAAARGAEGGK